ncbi:family 20 glycosylhydrolase [Chitinophaga lutea]
MQLRFTLCLLLAAGAVHAQAPSFPASGLTLKWEVVENGYQGKAQTLSTFTIINKTKQAFPASGWKIYYNFIRFAQSAEAGQPVAAGHVNGHLYTLTPWAGFKGIAPGDSAKINIVSVAWVTARTDAPEGPYLVWGTERAKGYAIADYVVPPSTRPEQLRRLQGETDVQTTAADIYRRNASIKDIPAAQLPKIFPTPLRAEDLGGELTIAGPLVIGYDRAFTQEAAYLANALATLSGIAVRTEPSATGKIRLVRSDKPAVEGAYMLESTADGVVITAGQGSGIFYGIQSLLGIAQAQVKDKSLRIPQMRVNDAPRFPFRSLSVDVARNFQSKQEVYRILDLMAMYKLNVFHFHLTDDEGWRIAIPGLPELTDVGARRAHGADELAALQPSFGSGPDGSPAGTGHYSKSDYVDIIRYAKARHIKVIPEIEVPGHARAAIKAMDARYARLMKEGKPDEAKQYRLSEPEDKSEYRSVQEWKDNVVNVALPSTYAFLEKVVKEVGAMHREAGAPLDIIHMGGDETPAGVWEKSPACQAVIAREKLGDVDGLWGYFYDKVGQIVNREGMQLYGWEEMGMRRTRRDGKTVMIVNPQFGARNFQVDVWNNVMGEGMEDLTYRLANGGYKVVLSGVSNYYFDMAYVKDYHEPGFYWGGYVDVDKPFYFIPFDLYKNAHEDAAGNPLSPATFVGKDRLTEYGQSNIVGIQGAIWGETLKNGAQLEYLVLPKLLGMAERAWAPNPAWATEPDAERSKAMYNDAWTVLANTIGKKELPRLAAYNYRIPTAGAIAENGKVLANVQLPGLVIRYTVDGKEPTAKSPVYSGPVESKNPVKLKVFDNAGRGGRTITVQP